MGCVDIRIAEPDYALMTMTRSLKKSSFCGFILSKCIPGFSKVLFLPAVGLWVTGGLSDGCGCVGSCHVVVAVVCVAGVLRLTVVS